jgi:hypothetical protein
MWVIHWNKIKPIYLSADKFKDLALQLSSSNLKKLSFFSSQRLSVINDTYSSFGSNKGRCELRSYINGEPKRYIYIASKAIIDEIKDESSGFEAYSVVDKMFRENNKKSMFSVFSGKKYKKEYEDIKGCVPIQISYVNPTSLRKIISNVYKADISSAFPSQIVNKSLPTLHDSKRVKGKASPTEEYPFAFYIKSHHLAIYNELNTKNFNNIYYGKYYKQMYNDSIKDEDEETILCKASENNLDYPFSYLYEHRGENKDFKFYMNACIGFFHKNSNPTLSMIAAVVIARCNNNILKKCARLNRENNVILFIATDSIAWIGKESKIAVDDKYLGSFTYEAKKCRFYAVGPKAYQIDNNGEVVTKYAGMKKDKQEMLSFGMLPDDSIYTNDDIYQLNVTKNGVYYPNKII